MTTHTFFEKIINNTSMKRPGLFSFFIYLMVTSLFLASCSEMHNSNQGKPLSIGSTAEILVVIQNDQQWNNMIGQTIQKYLAADMYGMPQQEKLFKLLHINAASFQGIFQKQRNILIVRIDPKIKEPKLTVTHDKWAAPQLIFTLTASSQEEWIKVFTAKKDYFIQKFMDFERKRIMDVFNASLDTKIMKAIKKNFSFTLNVPAGFYIAKTTPTFMWIRHEANRYSQGILIIEVPYKDTTQFSRENILTQIQRFQLHYVPGPTDGSFMTLDRKYVLPRVKRITDFPTPFAVETRGLWRVQNDFMGGPFVSYTFLNKNANKIVTLFGYVYYPNHKKRDLLLQVESILYSVKF
jgi:hypothetical protein